MNANVHIRGQSAITRILAVAADAAAMTPVCLELMRRGASVSALENLQAAAAAARQTAFDVILVALRPDINATGLFLKLLKAEALGAPRILLLADPAQSAAIGHILFEADETVSRDLGAAELADAAGIGVQAAAPAAFHAPAVFAEPKFRVLALPLALPRDMLPEGVAQVERGEVPDAIVLTRAGAAAAISGWISAATAAVVPVIDASKTLGARADAEIEALTPHALANALQAVAAISIRVQSLPESYHRTRDGRQMLLARLATRERKAGAIRDPNARQVVQYLDEPVIAGMLPHAENLVRAGMLQRKFFDKLQCCPSCNNSRLIVREECAKCRSGDVRDEPIVHHLRCGKIGPESDFRQGRDLICPKCRHHLEHFSVDYDKPGMLTLCNDCGHTTGEPDVGFQCLDCAHGFTSDSAKTRVYSEYELTEAGREAAFSPPISGHGGTENQHNSLRGALRRFVAANRAGGRECAVLLIKADPEGKAAQSLGEKRFAQTLALYSSLLHEVFEQEVEIIESGTSFLVLISGEGPDLVRGALPEVKRELEQHLSSDLAPRYHVYGPAEISSLL